MCALVACEPVPAGVHVTVESQLAPGADFDRLTVIAALADDDTPVGVQTLEGPDLHLPATFNFVSGKTVREGTKLNVRATAEKAGVVISSAQGAAVLEKQAGSALSLNLPVPPVVDAGTVTELCDNGVDDDGDGKADCADPKCTGKSCLAGGLTCTQGRCGCGGNAAGSLTEQTGYRPWMNPVALRLRVSSGQVAMVGGRSGGALSGAVDVLTLVNGTVSSVELNSAREAPVLAERTDGGLLVLGGRDDGGSSVSSFELVDPVGGAQELGINPAMRIAETSALITGDQVILAGGNLHDPPSSVTSSDLVVSVDLGSGAQATVGQLSAPHNGAAALLSTGELLLAGGSATGPTERTDLVAADGGIRAGPTLPAKLSDMALLTLHDGRALLLGGREDSTGTLTASARAFLITATAAGLSLRELSPMLSAKAKPRGTVLENGWVYVDDASGANANGEWFDPATETFIPATNTGRVGYAVVPANGATVLLVGGASSGNIGDGKLVSLTLRCQ
ncbi:MAG: hypothetical protein ACJ790_10350 [Myxococcaceae bacterium]